MLRIIVGVAAVAIGATVVLAQNPAAVAVRQNTMKALGGAAGALGQMFTGERDVEKEEGGQKVKVKEKVAFDLARVQSSLKALEENAIKGKTVFSDDSKGGKAKPEAFTNKADLFGKFDKLAEVAKALQVASKDEATFKAEFKKVGLGANYCKTCHDLYREPPPK